MELKRKLVYQYKKKEMHMLHSAKMIHISWALQPNESSNHQIQPHNLSIKSSISDQASSSHSSTHQKEETQSACGHTR